MDRDLNSCSRHISMVAAITESVCSLPAVATLSWCDDAAETLLALRRRIVATVSIGRLDASGAVADVEVSGAAASGLEPHRLLGVRRIISGEQPRRWALGPGALDSGARAVRLSSTGSFEAWRSSAAGRAWADLGVNDMAIGAASLRASAPERVVVVECGLGAGEAPLTDHEVSVLQAAMAPLSGRAALAFGAAPIDPSAALTAREQEVLEQLTLGKSVKEIAAELTRSPHTVHDHVKSLHRKLNASSRGELIARALGHIGASETRRRAGSPERDHELMTA